MTIKILCKVSGSKENNLSLTEVELNNVLPKVVMSLYGSFDRQIHSFIISKTAERVLLPKTKLKE